MKGYDFHAGGSNVRMSNVHELILQQIFSMICTSAKELFCARCCDCQSWHGQIYWRKTHQGLLNLQAVLLRQTLKQELLTAERLFWGSITTYLTFYWTAPQASLIGPCHRQGARQSERFDWFCVAFLDIWFSLAVMWRMCVYICRFDLPQPGLQDKAFFNFL